jgi:hypothetical protein
VCVQSQAVCSSTGLYALVHRHGARSQSRVCSIIGMALDREMCARSHVTALKSNGASELAMAAKATRTLRADKAYARSCPLCSSALHSIAPSALNRTGRG